MDRSTVTRKLSAVSLCVSCATSVTRLNKIEDVSSESKALLLCAELPIDNADTFAQWLIESFDFEGETVMVAPAASFTPHQV
jgi:hypothetical protein